MSHVTSKWVTSHVNESRHIQMSHVTFKWVTSQVWTQPYGRWAGTYATSHMNGVMSHTFIIHVTHTNKSCHPYERVMPHLWMTNMITAIWTMSWNICAVTYEWVMSYTWMSHATHMNESCHTYERVMSHIWVSHVIHINESCHTYEWVMSYTWKSRVIHMHLCYVVSCTATHCNTLQHTLKHTTTICNKLQHPATYSVIAAAA